MTRRLNYARRKSRGGKKLIPPNPLQWENEHNGLDLREDLGIPLDVPLDHDLAFEQMLPMVAVHPHGSIPAADKYLNHFRLSGSSAWSGMAITLPDGFELVFYNDSHPINRIRSTLMEEFYHIWLEHPKSLVRIYSEDRKWRTFNSKIEEEAYGSGAAALVPYRPMCEMLASGLSTTAIARHFRVSTDLVLFRGKVTKTYRRMRRP